MCYENQGILSRIYTFLLPWSTFSTHLKENYFCFAPSWVRISLHWEESQEEKAHWRATCWGKHLGNSWHQFLWLTRSRSSSSFSVELAWSTIRTDPLPGSCMLTFSGATGTFGKTFDITAYVEFSCWPYHQCLKVVKLQTDFPITIFKVSCLHQPPQHFSPHSVTVI